jgi:aryl carrier-like protein
LEVLLDPSADTIELRTAFANDDLASGVERFLNTFESSLMAMSDLENDTLVSRNSPGEVATTSQSPEAHLPEPDVDPQLLHTVCSELSSFLKLDLENVKEHTSLLSLGLDSLKAVALSRRLEDRGVSIQLVDIVRARSVRHLAASATTAEHSGETEDADLTDRERSLADEFDSSALKLDQKDKIRITPATALQAGMLSQVS